MLLAGGDDGRLVEVVGVPMGPSAAPAGMLVAGTDGGLVAEVVGAAIGAFAEAVVDDAVLELVGLLALRAWCTDGRCVADAAFVAGFGAEPCVAMTTMITAR